MHRRRNPLETATHAGVRDTLYKKVNDQWFIWNRGYHKWIFVDIEGVRLQEI